MSEKSIEIAAVGDISLGDHLLCLGFGVRSTIETKGHKFIFAYVKDTLKQSDIIFGNLEVVLSGHGLTKNKIESMVLRGQPEAINTLKNAGFNVLNIANNHSLQHGSVAFNETVHLLEKNFIDVVGLFYKNNFSTIPIIKEFKQIKIGFLGYSFVKEQYFKEEPLYSIGNIENIKGDIKRLQQQVDFVIVSCHWGMELIDRPSIDIIRLAREMVDSGANIIFGHHPHVFQGIEKYKDGIIFYSLGNFVFDLMWWEPCLQSAIIKIYLIKDNPITYNIIPVKINKIYQPVLLETNKTNKFLSYIEKTIDRISIDLDVYPDEICLKEYYKEVAKLENILKYKKTLYLISHLHKQKLLTLSYILKNKILKLQNI
jgi:gamma-polyglutamate biosynthesis protein CapA